MVLIFVELIEWHLFCYLESLARSVCYMACNCKSNTCFLCCVHNQFVHSCNVYKGLNDLYVLLVSFWNGIHLYFWNLSEIHLSELSQFLDWLNLKIIFHNTQTSKIMYQAVECRV